ncbi:MAG: hypothetical protein L3J82_02845 [Planctomycetes bacterium]|nr:hypothetical protein [Planctomycetota bacterium]
MKRFRTFMFALILIAGAFASGIASQPERVQITPSAPIVSAEGSEVTLAWSLPFGIRIETVDVMRAPLSMKKFVVLKSLDATEMSFTDSSVELGKSYYYQLRMNTSTGQALLSESATILVGGRATIRLVGGSLDRALFEVTLYRNGQRVTEKFLHSTGDEVGDLRYPKSLDTVMDFRLGPRLMKLELTKGRSSEVIRTPLKDASGEVLKGPSGKEIPLEFTVPGSEREVLKATVKTVDGALHELVEGESLTVVVRAR